MFDLGREQWVRWIVLLSAGPWMLSGPVRGQRPTSSAQDARLVASSPEDSGREAVLPRNEGPVADLHRSFRGACDAVGPVPSVPTMLAVRVWRFCGADRVALCLAQSHPSLIALHCLLTV
jgi:hypothetical protein